MPILFPVSCTLAAGSTDLMYFLAGIPLLCCVQRMKTFAPQLLPELHRCTLFVIRNSSITEQQSSVQHTQLCANTAACRKGDQLVHRDPEMLYVVPWCSLVSTLSLDLG